MTHIQLLISSGVLRLKTRDVGPGSLEIRKRLCVIIIAEVEVGAELLGSRKRVIKPRRELVCTLGLDRSRDKNVGAETGCIGLGNKLVHQIKRSRVETLHRNLVRGENRRIGRSGRN